MNVETREKDDQFIELIPLNASLDEIRNYLLKPKQSMSIEQMDEAVLNAYCLLL